MANHIAKNDSLANEVAVHKVSTEVEIFKLGELVHMNS